MARSLVDTNILIYARDRDEPAKRRRAIELIDGLAASGELILSVQCLNEFSATSLRRGVAVSEVETAVARWCDLGDVLRLEEAATTAA
jgi:predicted nucleic acid-binding protein